MPAVNAASHTKLMEDATVRRHDEFGGGYRLLIFHAPRIAVRATPGQFVHIRIPELPRDALRRPFSIYRADGEELHVLYKPVGRGTQAMITAAPGEVFSLIGPLGTGFPVPAADEFPVFVAGGYGVAPLSFLAQRSAVRGVVFIGARTARDILCVEDFGGFGWEARVATEDGTRGERGRVTALVDAWVAERGATGAAGRPVLYACGPEGLMKVLAARTAAWGWQAWLSLDRPMGCGVGACLACVQRVRDASGQESWARCCTEGPVFDARALVWAPEKPEA